MEKDSICIVAGGSGGHITPALVLGKRWKENNQNGSIIFFGKKLDIQIIPSEHLGGTTWLKLAKFPGKKVWQLPRFLLQFCIAFLKSFYFLRKKRPSKIISTGGLIAIPVCFAGKLLKIPIELYELNIVPGKATKLLTPLAQKISYAFAHRYPLRFDEHDKYFEKEKIIEQLHFCPTKKTIFILGGSQGSISLNNIIKRWIKMGSYHQIIHQTGSNDKTDWIEFYKKHGVAAHTFSYAHDIEVIKNFYLLADLVICRGGAGTLFELEFFEKPSIVVPLKNHAGGHQVKNVIEMKKRHPKLFHYLDQDELEKDPYLLDRSCTTIFSAIL
jgi:UDP-N-acetylglucosamine--N-acetylmuramyl-(pentapeptide) pyrophosphoryl-undecaprenol N-acetylglucosamine transferase